MKVASGATVRFALLQFAMISSFFSIVYMDRFVLDVVLTPLNAMRHVREFHFAFFDILSTVVFASIAIAYLIGRGLGGWRVAVATFAEGIALIRLGFEDTFYYVLWRESLPDRLPWLDHNPVLVYSSFLVTSTGLFYTMLITTLIFAFVWAGIWRRI